jgi:hypothetical protein
MMTILPIAVGSSRRLGSVVGREGGAPFATGAFAAGRA